MALGAEGVSLATWTLFSSLGCFWIIYGVDRRSAIIILGSAIALPLQTAVMARLRPWRSKHSTWTVLRSAAYVFVLCALPALLWGWPAGVYGAGIATVSNRVPQFIELIRDPDVTGCVGAYVGHRHHLGKLLGALLRERSPVGGPRDDVVGLLCQYHYCGARGTSSAPSSNYDELTSNFIDAGVGRGELAISVKV